MKVLMISTNDLSSKQSLGVTKKINGQYEAFQNLGCNTYNLCFNNGEGVLIHGNKQKIISKRKVKDYFTVIDLFDKAPIICKKLGIDFCYIRYPLADWSFMRMVRRLHKICKVVVEMPTYPYDDELKKNTNIVAKVNRIQDAFFRHKLNKYLFRWASFSDDDSIFKVKCINIQNGINIDELPFIGDCLIYEKDIKLVGVAQIQNYHGFDRVIEGLYRYYQNQHDVNVYFNIVGNGDENKKLEKLVHDYKLNDYVTFSGFLSGDELYQAYKDSNLGVGTLAAHRVNLYKLSTLKVKEYTALGIPFIISSPDYSLPEKCDFYYKVPADESPISITDISEFFNNIKNHREIHKNMRVFAEKKLTWDLQMKKVINEVKEL